MMEAFTGQDFSATAMLGHFNLPLNAFNLQCDAHDAFEMGY
jgi:hypothetical protein